MPEFKVRCGYSMKNKTKFYNDQKPQEYHYFIISNFEIIPNQYLCQGQSEPPFIIIPDSLLKGNKINITEKLKKGYDFKFIVNLGGDKTAKFDTNNRNWMVLKTKEYFENTVKKIGFWDSKNYFYEAKKEPEKPIRKQNNNSTKSENKNDWGKIVLICLPIVVLAFLSFLIIKWVSKKNK